MMTSPPRPERRTAAPSTGSDDDAACLERSVDEPGRFHAVFERHHDVVHRYAASRLGLDAAEDVVSETFLQAFRLRARFDPDRGRDALPWLLGIATNVISHRRRGEARHLRRLAAAAREDGARAASTPHRDDAPGSTSHVARLDAVGRRPVLLAALVALRPDERDVLSACLLGELSYAEAAVALGLPIGTVRSRMSRARERLRAALAAPT